MAQASGYQAVGAEPSEEVEQQVVRRLKNREA